MPRPLPTAFAAALAAALALSGGAAQADPKHCPPGHAMKGWCGGDGGRHRDRDRHRERHRDRDRYDDRDRRGDRDRYDDRDYRDGQRDYEDGYRAGYEDARDDYRRGDRIPRDRYEPVDDWRDRGWREPDPGYGYVRVDDRIYLILQGTGMIVDALSN